MYLWSKSVLFIKDKLGRRTTNRRCGDKKKRGIDSCMNLHEFVVRGHTGTYVLLPTYSKL